MSSIEGPKVPIGMRRFTLKDHMGQPTDSTGT